jgi:hypothetical protein
LPSAGFCAWLGASAEAPTTTGDGCSAPSGAANWGAGVAASELSRTTTAQKSEADSETGTGAGAGSVCCETVNESVMDEEKEGIIKRDKNNDGDEEY